MWLKVQDLPLTVVDLNTWQKVNYYITISLYSTGTVKTAAFVSTGANISLDSVGDRDVVIGH